jgi:hypothetical protein
MKQEDYKKIRQDIYPGDVIAFGGVGFISSSIKVVTDSPVSHVGIISSCSILQDVSLIQIAESTSIGKGFAGVKINRMSDHIRDYDGDIWWLPLSQEVRLSINVIDLIGFLISQVGVPYDVPQAIGSALDFIPDNREDLDRLFCSEYITAALEHVGVLKDINASEQTPKDVIKFGIYRDVYQLKGELKEILEA